MPTRRHATKATKKPDSGGQGHAEPSRVPSKGVVSSENPPRGAQQSKATSAPQPTTKRTTPEEKQAYDDFYTYLPMNSWLYDSRRDPLPSFPRTYEEVAQLVRETTKGDYDSFAHEIAGMYVKKEEE